MKSPTPTFMKIARKTLWKLILLLLAYTTSSGQTVNQFLHPDVWLRADKVVGSTIWQDVSGNARNATGLNAQNLPAMSYLNFNPCFVLDGSYSPFGITYEFSNTSRMTVMAVYQTEDSLTEKGVWSARKDTLKTQGLTTHKILGESCKIKYESINNTWPVVNTLNFSWKYVSQDTLPDVFKIAGNDSLTYRGKFAEFLVYPFLLTGRNLHIMQTYLSLKYGITLEGTNYINSKGIVLWNDSANMGYNNAIAGIGRDTTLKLHQKQSCSTSIRDIIVLGVSSIDSTNQSNPHSINEGDFLMWGNNKGVLDINWVDSAQTMGLLQRTWMLAVTGSTASSLPTTMQIDISGIQNPDTAVCQLVIDRNTMGVWNLNNLEYYSADSIGKNNKAYFSNILWDTDHSGSDIFTLFFRKDTIKNLTHNRHKSQSTDTTRKANTMAGSSTSQEQTANGLNRNNNSSIGSASNTYRVFPNPSSGTYELDVTLNKTGWVKIIITDVQGRVLQQYYGSDDRDYHFNGCMQSPGTFYVDFMTESERKVFPLVVR